MEKNNLQALAGRRCLKNPTMQRKRHAKIKKSRLERDSLKIFLLKENHWA
jgi:hypothetical protein